MSSKLAGFKLSNLEIKLWTKQKHRSCCWICNHNSTLFHREKNLRENRRTFESPRCWARFPAQHPAHVKFWEWNQQAKVTMKASLVLQRRKIAVLEKRRFVQSVVNPLSTHALDAAARLALSNASQRTRQETIAGKFRISWTLCFQWSDIWYILKTVGSGIVQLTIR